MLAKFKYRPWLTVITVFFNMKREAPRTLLSLSRGYQRLAADIRYEVVALDHGSMEPIDPPHTLGPGVKFTYRHIATTSCSPVTAINEAALQANGDFLMVHIDGARILSPGVLEATWRATKAFEQPFIYTLGWHLGPAVQNLSITQGYDQSKEDKLLEDIDWIHDGYRLFEASTLAMSSAGGFLNPIAESNCFTLSRRIWEDLGGFDPGFQSPGGGLANLDFFDRASHAAGVTPVCLLGEGTFHQIHGGVATNVLMAQHPMSSFLDEYRELRGHDWKKPDDLQPTFLGHLPACTKRFVKLPQ